MSVFEKHANVPPQVTNALTVDVEDYFHVSAFERCVSPSQWESLPERVCRNTERVLELFAAREITATFFILGWVAERHPELVRHIVEQGHEIACHGYAHGRITGMTRDAFRQDVDRARKLLQDMSGQPVSGYRAPSYSITAQTVWALDILLESGFSYDSSIFPIRHDLYGMPGAERFPHYIRREKGVLEEFPPTTLRWSLFGLGLNLPVSGGGYLRLLPARWISAAFAGLNKKGRPCVLYFHPWEIDPGQPRIKAPLKSRFRHYLNLDTTEKKLGVLLAQHRFANMSSVLQEVLPHDRH